MVIIQILDPWRSLEPLDTSAPVSQLQPLHNTVIQGIHLAYRQSIVDCTKSSLALIESC